MASTQTTPPAKVCVDASVLIAAAISQTARAHDLILTGLTRSFHVVDDTSDYGAGLVRAVEGYGAKIGLRLALSILLVTLASLLIRIGPPWLTRLAA